MDFNTEYIDELQAELRTLKAAQAASLKRLQDFWGPGIKSIDQGTDWGIQMYESLMESVDFLATECGNFEDQRDEAIRDLEKLRKLIF